MTTSFASRLWLRRFRSRPSAHPPSRVRPSLTRLEDRSTPAFAGGVGVAVGDVNGDSFPDIIAAQASKGSPLVTAVSGKDGTELLSFLAYDAAFTGGVYVAAGDIDGDGAAEIVTGTGNTGGPQVRVFDGQTGKERFSFFPYENSFRGGVIVAVADVTGDRKAEIITGTGVGGGPRVQVISAATQKPISDFFAYEDTFRGGVLVGAGDVDGDDIAEVITGTGVGGGPRVLVFEALTRQPVMNFFAYESSFRGGVLVGAGDTDGDGRDEIMTGTGPGGGPVVTSFDPATGKSEARFGAFDAGFRGGVRVAGADLTGDGRAEFVAGAGPGGEPLVSVFSSDGSKPIVTFSPFDPVRLPGAAINTRTPDPAEAGGTLPPAGLQVSQTRALVGEDQQLVFTFRADGPTAPSRVELYESDAAGGTGAFLLDLFDDGSFVHRDAAAGDGAFSNSFTVRYADPGDKFFQARVTTAGQTATFPVQVAAVPRVAADVIQQRSDQAAQVQDRLAGLIAQQMATADALTALATELAASPGTVRPGSVFTSGRGVFWESVEGLPYGALATLGDGTERDGPGSGTGGTGGTVSTTVSPEDCKGRALVLAPYFNEFEQIGGYLINDEADDIAQMLKGKNYDVQERYNRITGDQNITVDHFKDLGQYDVVVISSHGDQGEIDFDRPIDFKGTVTPGTPILMTAQRYTPESYAEHYDDFQAGRILQVGGKYALTPAFFEYYSGQMGGTVVIFGACRSARDAVPDDQAASFNSTPEFSQTFLGLGAAAFAGFSDYVRTGFAASHAIAMMEHLLADGTFNTIPGVGDTEWDFSPATFRVHTPFGKGDNKLVPKCDLLRDYNLQVTYTWPASQKDLDTGTLFLGGSVGFSCPGSKYMQFSGDSTARGGAEVATVDLHQAFRDGGWQTSVPVTLRAGWYIPAEGSGQATVFVSLKHKTTGEERSGVQMSISPGAQRGCAETVVGTVTVTVGGIETQERVAFTLA